MASIVAMMQNQDDILAALTKASVGPYGPRSLAGMVRKCLPLVLTLREDGASWEQLAALFAASGRNAGAEVIRKTVRRAAQHRADLHQPGPATEQVAASNLAPPPAERWDPTSTSDFVATPKATGPPPKSSTPSRPIQDGGSKGLALARRALQQRNKFKEIK